MRRIRPVHFAPVALAAALLAFASCGSEEAPAAAAETAIAATPVRVIPAARAVIAEKIRFTGTLKAWKEITITPETGGKIARIGVQEGDRVAAGQVLAELETQTVRLQLKQAEAGVAVAEANLNDARRNKERMDRLAAENAVSEQQREKIDLAYEAARAQLDQAQAALNLTRHALDVSIMRAPFAGIIASRNAEVGDVINPMMGGFGTGQGGVVTLVDYTRIEMDIAAAQNDVLRIRKGQPAVLTVPGLPGREFTGTVDVVNLAADPQTKKFGVRAVFENSDLALRPGTFGTAAFAVETHEDALIVPQRAVIEDAYVFIVRDGRAVRKDVTLGLQNDVSIEILSGLEPGDRVIVEGNFGLEDGAPVEIAGEIAGR